ACAAGYSGADRTLPIWAPMTTPIGMPKAIPKPIACRPDPIKPPRIAPTTKPQATQKARIGLPGRGGGLWDSTLVTLRTLAGIRNPVRELGWAPPAGLGLDSIVRRHACLC